MSTSSRPTIVERTVGFWRDQLVIFFLSFISFGMIGLVSAGVFSFIAPELAPLVLYPVLGSSLITASFTATLEEPEEATPDIDANGVAILFMFVFVAVRFAPLYLATVAASTVVGEWSLFLLVFVPTVDSVVSEWRWYLSPFLWPVVVLLAIFHAVGYLNELTLESVLTTSSFNRVH
jgi:hypothetical protein